MKRKAGGSHVESGYDSIPGPSRVRTDDRLYEYIGGGDMRARQKEPHTIASKFRFLNHPQVPDQTKKEVPLASPAQSPIKSNRIYTGSCSDILLVHKRSPDLKNILYEFYGRVLSIAQGKNRCEEVVLIRGELGTGPVIRGIFPEIDVSLDVMPYDLVRCVGQFINGRFMIIKIGRCDSGFLDAVAGRLNAVCHFAIKHD